MPLTTFTSGQVLTAAKMNEVARQAVITGTTKPSSPDTGMLFYHTTEKRLYAYSGSGWAVVAWGSSGGRVGTILQRTTGQNITGPGVMTAIQWNDPPSADADGFYPGSGGTITIPTGLGGIYMMQVKLIWSAPIGTYAGAGGTVRLDTSTTDWDNIMPAEVSNYAVSFGPIPFSAGATFSIAVSQSNNLTISCTARLDLAYIGP